MVYFSNSTAHERAPDIPDFAIAQAGERRAWWTFFLAVGLAFIVAVSSLLSMARHEPDSNGVLRTEQVIAALEDVLSLADDMEMAGRSSTMSGTADDLEPHEHASSRLNVQLDQLLALVSDHPEQNRRLRTLSQLLSQRQAEIARFMRVRWSKGFDAARATVLNGDDKQTPERIRRLINELERAESVRLRERLTESKFAVVWSIASVVLGSLLAVSTAIFARTVVRRDDAGNRRANAALAQRTEQLDARVAELKAELTDTREQLKLADAVFKNIQEGIVITDLACRIIAVNPAFCRVTEYQPEEVMGQHIRIIQSGMQDRSFYLQMWEKMQETGFWQGEIWNRRRSGDIYKEWRSISTIHDAAGKPKYYLGVASDLSRMNRSMTDLEHLAHHDVLTGLPNRLLLASRMGHSMERARRDGKHCAVLCLDLDRFKAVNDTLGHAAGDELLRQVAARIKARLRDVDTLARVGGDEFVVILEGICSLQEVTGVADALIAHLIAPFVLSELRNALIGISVGISMFPTDAEQSSELLEKADLALYLAKRAGGNRWHLSAQSDAWKPRAAFRPVRSS